MTIEYEKFLESGDSGSLNLQPGMAKNRLCHSQCASDFANVASDLANVAMNTCNLVMVKK